MSAPTATELKALKQFRLRVADLELEKETDLSMLKWLRVRELNIDQAEDMLRKHIQRCHNEKIAEIVDWIPPEFISENCPYEIVGHDNEGRPICVMPFGNWDVRKVIKSGMREPFLRYFEQMVSQLYAKMKENSLKFNSEITQCIFIVDFANYSMSQLTSIAALNAVREVTRIIEANYPDTGYKVYMVNSFRIFQVFFSLVKPMFSAQTIACIEIYTTPDKWMPVLQASLPLDQIPPEFGGRKSGRRISVGNELKMEAVDFGYSEEACNEFLASKSAKIE